MGLSSTRTFATYFDVEQVNATVGAAYKALASDYERRKEFIDSTTRIAIEARLELLRHTWTLMLDRSP